MPYKEILRKCGHYETVFLMDDEVNNPVAMRAHQDELCNECYAMLNDVLEVEMDYKTYKIEFGDCRTKGGSYDKESKRIIVFVPRGRINEQNRGCY